MYRKQVRRRRAVLLLLVAASLTLLSLYYRESNAGPLHGAEKVVSTIFSPFQNGADRALKPVRDLVNWFHETFDARGDKAKPRGAGGEPPRSARPPADPATGGQGALGAQRADQRRHRPGRHRPGDRASGRPVADRLVLDSHDRQGLRRRGANRRPCGRGAGAGREGHPDHPQHGPGHPDHRRRQRSDRASDTGWRDRRGRAQRRQPQRPAARLSGARTATSPRGRWW